MDDVKTAESSKGLFDNGAFYCEHLNDSHKDEIEAFSVRHPEAAYGLEDYIKNAALPDEADNRMRTYLVKDLDSDEVVGYFSLKAGMFSINEREYYDEEKKKTRTVFDTEPGIEIADFAVNGAYQDNHPSVKGVGVVIFLDFIRPIAFQIGKMLGVKYLYIFALPYHSLIERYEKSYHFRRLSSKEEDELHKRVKPFYDDGCYFMYQRL